MRFSMLLLTLLAAACQPRLLPARPVLDARRALEYPSGLRVLVESEPGSKRSLREAPPAP